MEKVKVSELELGDEFYYGVDKEKYKLVTKALQLFSDNEEITYIAQRSKDGCILETENLDVYIKGSNIGELTIKVNVEHNLDEVKEKLEEINKLRKQGI